MCGIAGLLDLERRSGSQELEALGRAMAATLNHRGPDAHGVWSDAEAGVALGHTRLHRRSFTGRRTADGVELRRLRHHL